MDVSLFNVRTEGRRAELDELTDSLAQHGQLQPILVQPKGDHFEVLIGQRRYLAALKLGWTHIDALVESRELEELDARVLSFAENVQRRDLSPRDKASTCMYLYGELHSIPEVARRLGVSPPTVRKWLGYGAVPEPLKEMVDTGSISAPLATRLAEHQPDTAKAVEIATRIAEANTPPRLRTRIITAVEEAPERSVDAVFERAEEMRTERQITFVLPARWAASLDRAAADTRSDPDELAREATIEWLEARQY